MLSYDKIKAIAEAKERTQREATTRTNNRLAQLLESTPESQQYWAARLDMILGRIQQAIGGTEIIAHHTRSHDADDIRHALYQHMEALVEIADQLDACCAHYKEEIGSIETLLALKKEAS